MTPQQSLEWWKKRLETLKETKFHQPLLWLMESANPIGFDAGQLRPGELGKWDFYYFCLQSGFGPPEEAAKAAGLDYNIIRREENADDARRQAFKAMAFGNGQN